jgi:hypothetical protein
VPIPNIAVKWLPCGCQKLHRTVYTYLKTNSCRKKIEIYSFSTNLPRYGFHRLGLGPRLFGKASETRCICLGVPFPNIAVKWLPCGCQKLHRTVYTYLKTNSCQQRIEIHSFSTSVPRYVFHRLGLVPQLCDKASDTRFVCVGVPIPNIAVKWRPCGCQKLHRTVFRHLKTNSCQKK